jgi:hypothetical protein
VSGGLLTSDLVTGLAGGLVDKTELSSTAIAAGVISMLVVVEGSAAGSCSTVTWVWLDLEVSDLAVSSWSIEIVVDFVVVIWGSDFVD